MSLNRTLRRTAGYTIDQTILIVAIIAILVTLVIITVGWQLINKSSGTKLASQFRQIEDANGQFYASYRMWPSSSYTDTATPGLNAVALTGQGATFNAQVTGMQASSGGAKNFVPGFRRSGTAGLLHTMGSGGTVTQAVVANPWGSALQGSYLVVMFSAVPRSDAEAADTAIDGGTTANFIAGRVQAQDSGTDCASGTALATAPAAATLNVCYAANVLQ